MRIEYRNFKEIELDNIEQDSFSEISQIYSFTTEMITGYFEKLELKDKAVLTVASSGDHIINAFLCGANTVDGFDINILALLYTELKLIGLQELGYKEFLEFFMINDIEDIEKNAKTLNFDIYNNKLRDKLSNNAKSFCDKAYKKASFNGKKLRNSSLFNNKYDNNTLKIKSNLYLLNEDMYFKARMCLKDKQVNLINENIINLVEKLQEVAKYGIIVLSNISDYAKNLYPIESGYFKKYLLECVLPLRNILNSNGKIVLAYLYDIETNQYRSEIDNSTIRETLFKDLSISYSEEKFKSVIDSCYDKVIII